MNQKFKTVIFDLDGTLTDSGIGIINTIKYSLDKMQVDYSKVDLNTFIGPPLLDSYMDVLKMTKEDGLKAIDFYQERFATIGKFENKVYDGIIDTLERLVDANFTLLIATTKPEIFAIEIAKHFGFFKYFEVISGGSLDQKLSDKAEILDIALNKNKTDRSSAIMIGDRMHDVIGAHKNNIPCIGVTYGYGSKQELIDSKADYILDSPSQIADFLIKNKL